MGKGDDWRMTAKTCEAIFWVVRNALHLDSHNCCTRFENGLNTTSLYIKMYEFCLIFKRWGAEWSGIEAIITQPSLCKFAFWIKYSNPEEIQRMENCNLWNLQILKINPKQSQDHCLHVRHYWSTEGEVSLRGLVPTTTKGIRVTSVGNLNFEGKCPSGSWAIKTRL